MAIGMSSERIIDQKGIREANRLAMCAALDQITDPGRIIIDGRDNYVFSKFERMEFLVK